jgi:cytochrome c peroxidase
MSIERWLLPLVMFAAACNVEGAPEGDDPVDPSSEGAAVGEAPADSGPVLAGGGGSAISNTTTFINPSGAVGTFSKQGSINTNSDFFDSFGTNGRVCSTCHQPSQGFSIEADEVDDLFEASDGKNALFRPVDGANSPNANVSTESARRTAYSMLRKRGVIRVGLPIPPTAEFELTAVNDPYGFASAAQLSLFRRPLPSTNLATNRFVMWDGRETQADFRTALSNQANNATLGHAQASASLSTAARNEIVDFELALFTAQAFDFKAGVLSEAGATGGPQALSTQTGAPGPFTIYNAWASLTGTDPKSQARKAIARGQALFNSPTTSPLGGCNSCHNVANIGTSVIPAFFDIGVSAAARRTADMPLYTLRNKTTGQTVQTTDPGRALITGLWADVNTFKVPGLRGLASHAPYFHDGSAATLLDVVKLYEQTFGFVFSAAEEADLVAFLKAL